MTIFFYCLLSWANPKEVTLPYFVAHPKFAETNDGIWWLADYGESWLIKVDPSTNLSEKFEKGSGQGPGEFRKPLHLFALNEESLVLLQVDGKTSVFNAITGEFRQKIIDFRPFEGAVQWDNDHFLMIWGASKPGSFSFDLYRFDGTQVDSWPVPQPKWQKEKIIEQPTGYAIDREKTVFISYMAAPEVLVYPYKKPQSENWRLKPPSGYIIAPGRDIDRNDLYNREKLNKYLQFTRTSGIFCKESLILVSWSNPGRAPTYDLYRLPERALISRDNEFEGMIIHFDGKNIITCQDADGPDESFTKLRKTPAALK